MSFHERTHPTAPTGRPSVGAPLGQPPVNGRISFWMDQGSVSTDGAVSRPPLRETLDADVCIVGGGLTGMWTAFWLSEVAPALSVVVLEAEQVAFGASGRSTGWLSGKLVGNRATLAAGPQGPAGVVRLQRSCTAAVADVLRIAAALGIDCAAVHAGYLDCARTPAQLARLEHSVRTQHQIGLGAEDRRLLSAVETSSRVRIRGLRGAVFSPHCARIDPAALTRGLADAVTARGVRIHEHSRVRSVGLRTVRTDAALVRAKTVVQATEAYSSSFPGRRRSIMPVLAPMAVTAPVTDRTWAAIGWEGRECVSGAAHRYFYGVRTADDRIAMGGNGMTYRFGSRMDDELGSATAHMRRRLVALLAELFGADDLRIAHVWCGPVGVPRDFSPTVCYDAATGQAEASGYVGQGLTGSYLAGRTLADLISGRRSEFTGLPWVGRRRPSWEPEPLRWLGAAAVQALYARADRSEQTSGIPRTSRWAGMADIVGRHR